MWVRNWNFWRLCYFCWYVKKIFNKLNKTFWCEILITDGKFDKDIDISIFHGRNLSEFYFPKAQFKVSKSIFHPFGAFSDIFGRDHSSQSVFPSSALITSTSSLDFSSFSFSSFWFSLHLTTKLDNMLKYSSLKKSAQVSTGIVFQFRRSKELIKGVSKLNVGYSRSHHNAAAPQLT